MIDHRPMKAKTTVSRDLVRISGELVRVPNLGVTEDYSSITDLKTIIALFVSEQRVKASSRELYARTITRFFDWVSRTRRGLGSMTRRDIDDYTDYLSDSKTGLSTLTQASYIISVRKFFEWTESHKLYPNIAKGVKTPPREKLHQRHYLPQDNSRDFLSWFSDKGERDFEEKSSKDSHYLKDLESLREYYKARGLRDFAIVNLMIRTGLRTIEVSRLRIKNLSYISGKRVLYVWGKGRNSADRYIRLSDKAYQPIEEYLRTRSNARPEEPLFTSVSRRDFGQSMSTRSISRICKEGMEAIGLRGREYTAHSLRSTTACLFLKNGGSLREVQTLLRHSSPNTTQIYLEDLREEEALDVSVDILDKVI